jgi:hypothetical protein
MYLVLTHPVQELAEELQVLPKDSIYSPQLVLKSSTFSKVMTAE